MITKEAIEAACAALNKRDRGNAISIPDVVAILTAAFAAMPGPAVRVKALEWRKDRTAKALGATWMVWPYSDPLNDGLGNWLWQCTDAPPHTSGRCHNEEEAHASAQADYEARIRSALTPAPDLASENERLRAALNRQGDNMAFVINHATLPEQWMTKFMAELAEDRAALERT